MFEGILSLLIGQAAGGAIVSPITKSGLQYAAPLVFVFLRFFFASILFLPFYWFSKKKRLLGAKDYKKFMILAAFLFINVTFFTIGIQFTTAIMSQILYLATPIIVSVLAYLLLREKITKQKLVGLFIALCGVLFLLFQSGSSTAAETFGTPLGNGIILIAILGYSGWILYSRRLVNNHTYSSSQTTFFTFIFIALYLLLLLPFQQILVPSHVSWVYTPGVLSAVLVSFGSVMQYFFLQLGIKKTNAFTASLFQYTGPIFTGLVSIPLLHEKPTFALVLGGILIVVGVFYATSYDRLKHRLVK